MYFYFGRYFLTYDFGDRDHVIGQGHDKVRLDRKVPVPSCQFALDNPRLFLTVDVQVAFGANLIGAVPGKINLLNNLTRKRCLWILFTFQVVFVEMLPLKFAVKAAEGRNVDYKWLVAGSIRPETLSDVAFIISSDALEAKLISPLSTIYRCA
jgi:hypothetical protein